MVKRVAGALLLSLEIEQGPGKSVSLQLYTALRDLILSGGLRAGDRLPASRTLAKDLGVSRTTVIDVFERLVSEELIQAQVGAGTFVSRALDRNRLRWVAEPAKPGAPANDRKPRLSHSITKASRLFSERLPHEPRCFTTALPAFDAFPMALWSRQVAKHWRARRDVVMGYGDPAGYYPLRRAIASHLKTNRGIDCEPEQVFVVGGAQQAFHLIGLVLLNPGDKVWFENPGAIGARNSLVAGGAELVPLPVDGDGMVVEEGLKRAPDFRLAFVTPTHQQPLGVVMSLERRLALLRAAEAANALIIEDDYDGEFCYGKRPLPVLKSVDTTGCVIYVGTFSKTLFPALRLGYFLAPPALVETFERVASAFLQGVPSNPQACVADFMEQGHFATHLRRMRRIYAERYRVLRDAAEDRWAGLLEVAPTDTGLHTIGLLADGLCEAEVSRAAERRNITVAPIDRFCLDPIATKGLVLGFSGTRPDEIRNGVNVLGEVLEDTIECSSEVFEPAPIVG